MLRTCTGMMIVIAGMTLGGCGNKWMNSWTDRSGESQEGVRFDANGNKIYDSSVRNTGTSNPGYNANGDMTRNWDNRNTNNANGWSNDQRGSANDSRNMQDGRHGMWNDQKTWDSWNDRNVTSMQSSDLPQPVLATFQRQSGGAELMETGWANHDGKKCYCVKSRKDGAMYKMISDADGNLIAMKRID